MNAKGAWVEQDGAREDRECIAVLPQGLQQDAAQRELFDEGRDDGVRQEHPQKLVNAGGVLRFVAVEGHAVGLEDLHEGRRHGIGDDDGHEADADGLDEEDVGLRLA